MAEKKKKTEVVYQEEELELSAKDIEIKLQKIQGYLLKTESRLKNYEKKLIRLRNEYEKDKSKVQKALNILKKRPIA